MEPFISNWVDHVDSYIDSASTKVLQLHLCLLFEVQQYSGPCGALRVDPVLFSKPVREFTGR